MAYQPGDAIQLGESMALYAQWSKDPVPDALNYVAQSGVIYFAFCTRISACESNHGFYGDICPICGKPKVTTYQRIVG